MDDGSNHAPDAPQSPDPIDGLMNAPETDALVLSDTEKLVLQLYDQVRELELERSLLEAQQNAASPDPNLPSTDLSKALLTAEREATEARAAYLLRNKIVDQVLTTDPILKAVHAPSPSSRRLPLHTRDLLALHLSALTTRHTALSTSLTTTTKSLAATNRHNAALAAALLPLTTTTTDEVTATDDDPELREAERGAQAARRRWRCVRGVVAGVVVGSGVEWAGEEGLRGLVLEGDEDELMEGEGEGEGKDGH